MEEAEVEVCQEDRGRTETRDLVLALDPVKVKGEVEGEVKTAKKESQDIS